MGNATSSFTSIIEYAILAAAVIVIGYTVASYFIVKEVGGTVSNVANSEAGTRLAEAGGAALLL